MDEAHTRKQCRWWLAVILLAVSALRVLYLFAWCPYDLAPDEAHYWDWSRHLDWSYYSKGPLIAWLIRGACELFGPFSLTLHGTLMPAVRLPAVLFGALMLLGVYVLTAQTYKSERLALRVVLVTLTLPPLAACSIISTIDSPFLCCWVWALVGGRAAIVDGRGWAWPLTGVFVLLGILAKYTMALWLVSAGLFLLVTPLYRPLLGQGRFWLLVAIAGLSALPILWWNSQHDWVTFRHVAGQAGVPQGTKNVGIRWLGPLEYVGGQFGLLLGVWFVLWVVALRQRYHSSDMGERYLWWLSVPTFAVFGLSSIKSAGQLNWPVAAYVSGIVLVAGYLRDRLTIPAPRLQRALRLVLVVGATASVLLHDTRFLGHMLKPVLPEESTTRPTPLRAFDPAARTKGWHYLATELDELRSQLRSEEGSEPILAATKWDYPGQLGFWCAGQPTVYSLGPVTGDRHSQYDLWHPNPVDDAQVFHGRTFLFVGNWYPKQALESSFKMVALGKEIVYRENGLAVARWSIWVCRDFQGFDPALRTMNQKGH